MAILTQGKADTSWKFKITTTVELQWLRPRSAMGRAPDSKSGPVFDTRSGHIL